MAESSSITVSGRRRLLVEFERSGMTRQAFCQERSIALHTLDYYRHKHKNRAKPSVARLLPVEFVGPLPPRSCCLRVELVNGLRIAVEEAALGAMIARTARRILLLHLGSTYEYENRTRFYTNFWV
jgi:hypothetical protein